MIYYVRCFVYHRNKMPHSSYNSPLTLSKNRLTRLLSYSEQIDFFNVTLNVIRYKIWHYFRLILKLPWIYWAAIFFAVSLLAGLYTISIVYCLLFVVFYDRDHFDIIFLELSYITDDPWKRTTCNTYITLKNICNESVVRKIVRGKICNFTIS